MIKNKRNSLNNSLILPYFFPLPGKEGVNVNISLKLTPKKHTLIHIQVNKAKEIIIIITKDCDTRGNKHTK